MTINLTEKAAAEVTRIINEGREAGQFDGERIYLRLAVKGGGCSGFQHTLNLDHHYNENADELLEKHGVPIVVDRKSALYLDGVEVDFINEINRRGFHVKNPAAKTTCGCGSSFSM